ncbi:rhomboid family intramembrane serine protease [Rasiella rasia]|uniref:Rhomboid family intramembrane serine protease n=1 Tax=Rasiella rasia TaxID=2744027 RepID=A0A6G6GL11_9FLAO|nr:rhomboid family intramembrane serine protease [Rasiella rasia]QIE59238.1 rhomboid family intramembrane serine protease [Rasiella rasia]
MSAKKPLEFSLEVITYPLLFVFVAWLVFWAETRFKVNLNYLGIVPKSVEGLRGILFAPFIHGSLKHLFNNSIPLLVLGTALFYFYRNIRFRVFFIGFILTGLLTWIIGRPATHIGASGIVYLLASFLFFKGIFSKQYQLTALAFVVVFLYGSLLWYVFPIDPKISWEGHLSGLLVGLLLAVLFRKNPVQNKKFEWEKESYNPEDDEFMKHFDEDGNFIESLPVDDDETVSNDELSEKKDLKIVIRYSYKKSDKKTDTL